MTGQDIHKLATQLWPITRSLTGDGVRDTLAVIQKHLPQLKTYEVPSGSTVFDWNIPKEWRISDAWIMRPDGLKICELSTNNLHLMGYSTPVNQSMSLEELQPHLYSLPEQPDAVPYVTSYYQERWGFCLSQNERDSLPDGQYTVFIDSELFDGSLTYAELVIPGETDKEIFLSTYICHPSMANNEISGPCVTTFLAKWLYTLEKRHYTYRIVFIPETIGSITYLSKHKDHLKEKVVAGFNISCVGDDRTYSYLPSRTGNTISDRVARHVLEHVCADYKSYAWTDRGSDERQYCAPGVDLPIASIMRTKYGCYPEYHTSLDDLQNVVTAQGLEGGFNALRHSIESLEHNCYPQVQLYCEPQLGKRGLYPTISSKGSASSTRLMMNLISYSDGQHSLLEIADICSVPVWDLYSIVEQLSAHDVIEVSKDKIITSGMAG
jgi:aminopeptidase-like protein